MKTLFLAEMYGIEDTFFFELKGDYSHLDRVIINGLHDSHASKTPEEYGELQEELWSIIDDESGELKVNQLDHPTKNWDHFCHVGFMP